MIGIVDLRMGNLRSVANAVASLGLDARMVTRPSDIDESITHLILPGVGSFGVAMAHMAEQELVGPIRRFAARGQPVLGICLGMQLLASRGTEGGENAGLDLVAGTVVRFDATRVPVIPHVGWNELRLVGRHPVFERVKSGVDFYYVHSYHFACSVESELRGVFEYGGADYAGFVGRDNVVGFQFHPEKSQANGLRLLENFCEWDGKC